MFDGSGTGPNKPPGSHDLISYCTHTSLLLTLSPLAHTAQLCTHHRQNKSVSDREGERRGTESKRAREKEGENEWGGKRETHTRGPEKPTAHRGVISYISQLCLMWAREQDGRGLGWNSKRRRGDDVISWRVLKRTLCSTSSVMSLFSILAISPLPKYEYPSPQITSAQILPHISAMASSQRTGNDQRHEAISTCREENLNTWVSRKASRDLDILLFPCAVLQWNLFSGSLMEQQGKIALLSIFISYKVPSTTYVT